MIKTEMLLKLLGPTPEKKPPPKTGLNPRQTKTLACFEDVRLSCGQVAEKTGDTNNSIRRVLKQLEKAGCLTSERGLDPETKTWIKFWRKS
jgi:DNA-binding MarR family transcriptional regulator